MYEKNLIYVACNSLVCFVATAQPPAGDAKPGDWYGEKVQTTNAINIADIPAKLENNKVLNTKVKAKVLDVCAPKRLLVKAGRKRQYHCFCKNERLWLSFCPTAVKGKTIVIDGEVKMVTTSVDELAALRERRQKTTGRNQRHHTTQKRNSVYGNRYYGS